MALPALPSFAFSLLPIIIIPSSELFLCFVHVNKEHFYVVCRIVMIWIFLSSCFLGGLGLLA